VSGAVPASVLDALRAAIAFEALGERSGNVTVGRGRFEGRALRMGLVENRVASGSIGTVEADRLAALLRVATAERSPLLLFLDSAGAKVSEGLAALGAFRHLFRAGLDAALAGVPIAAVLGRNCYGGSSMLAHLAGHRLFSPATRLAMSGPAILASAAGMDPLDDMFRAMAEAAISAGARSKASGANVQWEAGAGVDDWLRSALSPPGEPRAAWRDRHAALAGRLARPLPEPPWEAVRRRDLERIYPDGYEAREAQGLLDGRGRRGNGEERFVGIVGNAPLGAERAWRFADAVWRLEGVARLEVFLDCATHAARLEDERIVLTEFIVDMSVALALCAARGVQVGLTVLGKAGGGVYVALAAPARRVVSTYGADIQVLPGAAVAAILGESREAIPSFDDYRSARVAEEEMKLGLAS
jgi:Carboxyl transferase domain